MAFEATTQCFTCRRSVCVLLAVDTCVDGLASPVSGEARARGCVLNQHLGVDTQCTADLGERALKELTAGPQLDACFN